MKNKKWIWSGLITLVIICALVICSKDKKENAPPELNVSFHNVREIIVAWTYEGYEYEYTVLKKEADTEQYKTTEIYQDLKSLLEGEYTYKERWELTVGGNTYKVLCLSGASVCYDLKIVENGVIVENANSNLYDYLYSNPESENLLDEFLEIMKPYATEENCRGEHIC